MFKMFMNFMNNLQHEYPCSCSETVHGHGMVKLIFLEC